MKVENLARAMIDLFLAHLLVGDDQGFEERDVMFWAWTYFENTAGGEHSAARAKRLAQEILAYRRALQRMKNSPAGKPDNVVALILYNVSHSGKKDPIKRWRWERALSGNHRFRVSTVEEALDLLEDLRGTYLPERLIGQFLGKTVNLDRVARMVEEEYMALAEEGQHAGA
ncbi:MAG: hypothetical protein NZ651_05270 [Candidatus Bipolaricaulota bacterium]|nr:hypothetical protein [Candidatus Bipolaricaulota bacterium]MDW8127163.1 hypothetical protein [Candidatus Bipolaricaulota bacterium]